MTAKEKALELVTYFEILINGLITENKMIPKECAIKLVTEIIDNVRTDYHDHQWYRQVKQEIKKL